ncbi:MAG: purine-binding chemotaxis protein CheW [Clostridia bacterium]|nr:purine-binding chemotaxis protein CheW [Clostridia bacterium]
MNEENGAMLLEEEDVAQEVPSDSRNYLIFFIDDLKLGVDAAYVVEILNNVAVTPLPVVPHYVRGVINMRGQLIPVMDVRLRLGKMENEGSSLLVVLDYEGTSIGILVDAVDKMISIPNRVVMPVPAHSQKLVNGMCTIPDGSGTMLVLDCVQLLSHD